MAIRRMRRTVPMEPYKYAGINAVIRMGDRPIPPVGAVIEPLHGAHRHPRVVLENYGSEGALLFEGHSLTARPAEWFARGYAVKFLPGDSPPFEDWPRSPEDDGTPDRQ